MSLEVDYFLDTVQDELEEAETTTDSSEWELVHRDSFCRKYDAHQEFLSCWETRKNASGLSWQQFAPQMARAACAFWLDRVELLDIHLIHLWLCDAAEAAHTGGEFHRAVAYAFCANDLSGVLRRRTGQAVLYDEASFWLCTSSPDALLQWIEHEVPSCGSRHFRPNTGQTWTTNLARRICLFVAHNTNGSRGWRKRIAASTATTRRSSPRMGHC